MDDKRIEESGSVSIKNIIMAIKNNLVMIILVVVLCAGCGLGYAFLKKPYYTATESVIYIATDEGMGEEDIASDINIMRGFFDTVVDFCTTGVVVDRANFYYVNFMNELDKDPTLTLEEYIARFDVGEDPYSTSSTNTIGQGYVLKENIETVVNNAKDSSDQFSFSIRYTDPNKVDAVNKVKLIVLAFNREIQSDGLEKQGKYFSGIENKIMSLGLNGVVSSVSKMKYTVIGGIIGVLLSAAALYLTSVLDNTVKSKKTAEHLTGVNVLAVLDNEGGKR